MTIYTKYVMDAAGHFAIINKNSGMEHQTLAHYIDGPVVSAGFISTYNGVIQPYGQSISLDLRAREGDGDIIMAALEAGTVLKNYDTACFCESWVAFNDPAAQGKAESVKDLAELVELGIMDDEF